MFFESDEEFFNDDFDVVDFEEIIGHGWQVAIKDLHYNSATVQNWDQLEQFFKENIDDCDIVN